MRESRTSGFVRGAHRDMGPYRDPHLSGAGLPKRKFAAQWLRDYLEPGSQTQGSIEIAAERDGVCISTLRRAKFDLGICSHKDCKSGAWWWTLPRSKD
jgi:hypothetical protein